MFIAVIKQFKLLQYHCEKESFFNGIFFPFLRQLLVRIHVIRQ